ncbi:MAG: Asp-tRNA(Asn)/Glu-tRNA(Gln) amidotransferase subunit GatC [Kosmotoga sp.]|nr:MAG: Asp-tRNA(Asn)/Glu-tRNA(Gln) amidotransferase subunit GatC [Kosmotoga sp.]
MNNEGINIDEKLLKHLQELSHLKLEQDEQETLKNDINKILDYIEKLKEVEVEDVDKQITPVENNMELRPDEPVDFENKEQIIELFPDSEDRYLKVPKIY